VVFATQKSFENFGEFMHLIPMKCPVCKTFDLNIFATNCEIDYVARCIKCQNICELQIDKRPFIDVCIKHLVENSVGAEIGTWLGKNAHRIVALLKPKDLYLVDTWKTDDNSDGYPCGDVEKKIVEDKFANNESVHIIQAKSEDACGMFGDNSLDWVYIDANHTKIEVMKDIAYWLPKVKNGGIIGGHDYDTKEVKEAIGVLLNKFDNLEKDWWAIKSENLLNQRTLSV
jgi:hypothetical protein